MKQAGRQQGAQTISAFDAKTHLSVLLDRVTRGERITIVTHGVAAAMLAPVEQRRSKFTYNEIVQGMKALRARVKARGRKGPRYR
jgi:prevent-host-death family protein